MNAIKFLVNIFFAICFMNLLLFKANASDNLSLNLNHESPEEHEHSNSFDEENRVKYVGAVLEYEPFNKWSEEGKGFEVLRKNSRTIVKFAEKAKFYNADIIIAPECGIQSFYMFHNNTENFLTFTQYVPDPSLRMVVCDQEEEPDNKYEAIKILSCGSLANEIYIVANLAEFEPCSEEKIDQTLPWRYEIQENCPKKGYFIYNTQVVFDRKGAVIARYRKQNLYHEPLFTPGSHNSEAIFITDFNVAFTLQICFDIVHWNPGFANVKKYGIRDVAMSTAWFDTLPFYLANGVENGFSRGLGVNLLVSGYHRPEEGNLGSGIFKGYAMDNTSLYSFDENSGNVLLVASVDTVAASSLPLPLIHQENEEKVRNRTEEPSRHNDDIILSLNENLNSSIRHRKFYYEDELLPQYTKVLLNISNSQEILNRTVCSHREFCCTFNYKYSGNQTYYFFVFSGHINVEGKKSTIESNVCAVVWCQNSDYKTCGHIEAESEVQDSFSYLKISSDSLHFDAVLPTYYHRNTKLIDNDVFDLNVQGNFTSITSVRAVENLLTVAFQGKTKI